MNREATKTKTSRIPALAGALLAVAIVALVPAWRVRAQQAPSRSQLLVIHGFQANSSSPFILQGDLIGNGVWQRLVGPILSNTFATLPAAPATFDGAGCQAEYSQDQIVAQDGSTIIVNVYGLRCVPDASPGAHTTSGSYSIIGGTGRFQNASGTGTVSIDAHADGSASIFIHGPNCETCRL